MGGTQKSCCRRCNSSGSSNNSGTSSGTDLETVRSILEEGYSDLTETADQVAYGTGDAYRDAYHDALDSVPDDVMVGDLDEVYAEETEDRTAVLLRYGDIPARDDWVDRYTDRLEDALEG